jgi:hypothetical protein
MQCKSIEYKLLNRSAPVGIRTSNLLIRSQMLYPVELRAPESQLICGGRIARQLTLERSRGLFRCDRLLFFAELLKARIAAQWVPDWIEPKKGRRNGRWLVIPARIWRS